MRPDYIDDREERAVSVLKSLGVKIQSSDNAVENVYYFYRIYNC